LPISQTEMGGSRFELGSALENFLVYGSYPEVLNELFLERRKNLEDEQNEIQQLVNQLKIKEITEGPQSNYKYYEGISGIKGMWHEINSLLTEKSTEQIYGAKKQAIERLIAFYDEHHKIRNKLNAKAKIIIPYEFKSLGEQRKNKNTEVRFEDLTNEAEWGIVDDLVYIQYIITEQPRGFLIKDKIFAETFRQVFEQAWKQAKS
ncbi:hypothetical protein HY489_02160, partial [Candidatus Woesearchaeota archaeon]|nr:hypothetical protein [Candidatus Woesearchaeota archaeon]